MTCLKMLEDSAPCTSLSHLCLIRTERSELLDRLAIELCTEGIIEQSEGSWRCAEPCERCKKDAINVLRRLRIEALAANKEDIAVWLTDISTLVNPSSNERSSEHA